jgi:hypothetical protein
MLKFVQMAYNKIILFSFFLILVSCKKDTTSLSNDPVSTSYYLTASINGIESEFNTELHSTSNLNTTTPTRWSFTGIQQRIQDTAVLGFSFLNYNNENITSTTTYPNSQISLLIGYNQSSSNHIYYNDQYGNNFTVLINDITNDYISGSFYGLMMDERIPSDTIIVTNGKFKVPITR